MTDRFLKAKHWQLFLLMYGIPMFLQFMVMGSMMYTIATHSYPDLAMMVNHMKLFLVIMILFMAVFYGWFWSVAIGLQKKVPEHVKLKVRKFKIFFFISMAYMFLFSTVLIVSMNGLFVSGSGLGFGVIGSLFFVILPLHLFAMFCVFYSLYFVAKTFKTVELQHEVKFADFAGEFLLIWFYPIGVWVVQPKINKMIEE